MLVQQCLSFDNADYWSTLRVFVCRANAKVDRAQFQIDVARKEQDHCAEAKGMTKMADAQESLYMAKQDLQRAKADQETAKKRAKDAAKGPPLEGDRQFKFDIPLGDNSEKFQCPKFDLFGCGCKSLPSYETLSGGDCADLKNIITQLRENDFKKATAMSFQAEGKGMSEFYDKAASAAQNED